VQPSPLHARRRVEFGGTGPVTGDLAVGGFLPVNGAPLLCLAGAWGRLTAGSHVSVLTARVGLGAQHRVHLAFCFGSVYSTGCA